MPTVMRKVVAYITWNERLLVFSHPDFPEAGIQVPAGTIEPGESPAEAAMREAFEETGLPRLTLVAPLGEGMRDVTPFGKDELHHRYFFHLRCVETPPETWRHWEEFSSDGGARVAFDFFWAALPDDVPPLIAGHDAYLSALIRSMGLVSA
jgi:8-oxo-dGTP diphosphatase